MLGHKPPAITYFLARRLKLMDPRVVKKYLDYLEKACHRDNIYIEMDALHNQAVYPLTDTMAKKYEDLDDKIEQLMEEAEKQCRGALRLK